jgi:hypothetical protein
MAIEANPGTATDRSILALCPARTRNQNQSARCGCQTDHGASDHREMKRSHELIALGPQDRAEKCCRNKAAGARDSTVET